MSAAEELVSREPGKYRQETGSTALFGASLMGGINKRARYFILSTSVVGALLIWWQYVSLEVQQPVTLAVACVVASLFQIRKTEGATSTSSFNLCWVVYGAMFALLGTPETVVVIIVAQLVKWAWHRSLWYVQTYNIASFAIAASIAELAYNQVSPIRWTFGPSVVLIIFAGNFLFTLINHLMVGGVLLLARGQTFEESGILSRTTFFMDLGLLCLGTSLAIISLVTPYAIVFMAVVIHLLHTVLKIPALQRQSRLDPKTGLYNATFFDAALEKEFEQAEKLDHPLCVVMADLDRLRKINNTYGHLAGDAVLKKVAQILNASARQTDVVGRFGGEEFAILMPNTTPRRAFVEIEAMRKAIEAADFTVDISPVPIKATMSFGIASRNGSCRHARRLIHLADLAMYDAKRNGRNLTTIYNDRLPPMHSVAQAVMDSEMESSELLVRVNP
jgi:diguanylate cyclase (GGDEF)-like protein